MASPAILQIHASRRCNLACAHCYSSSSPKERDGLRLPLLERLFEDAAAEGYGVLNVSGGEPLLDPDLFYQLKSARRAGLAVDLVTNGTLVTERRAAALAASVDLVAVSIDGPPQKHDEIRRSKGAFDKAVRGLRRLREAGVRVAVIHTARVATLADLPWLFRFAREEGAVALQIHPLERAGRARESMAAEFAQADLATRLSLLVQVLGGGRDDPHVHLDVSPVAGLGCVARPQPQTGERLAAHIDPLVVEADGSMVPWTYGVSRALMIGRLTQERLSTAAERYRRSGLDEALRFSETVRAELIRAHPWPFVNWHACLAAGTTGVGAAEKTEPLAGETSASGSLHRGASWGQAPRSL